MKEIRTYAAQETCSAGKRLGGILQQGDVVCLSGDLGTGKTAFTQGLAEGLGITGYITSPTFTLVNEYRGRLPLYHFDVYRIADPEEMLEIGFEEYLYGDGVVVVEWAELVQEVLPSRRVWVTLRKDLETGLDARIITLDFQGEDAGEREEAYERVSGHEDIGG